VLYGFVECDCGSTMCSGTVTGAVRRAVTRYCRRRCGGIVIARQKLNPAHEGDLLPSE